MDFGPGVSNCPELAFDRDERLHWHFIPTEMFQRRGLTIKQMNDSQRKLAHELLKADVGDLAAEMAALLAPTQSGLGRLGIVALVIRHGGNLAAKLQGGKNVTVRKGSRPDLGWIVASI